MPGPFFWPFVTDNHNITRDHLTTQNGFHSVILRFVHFGRATEHQTTFIHTGSFYDTVFFRDVAVQHRQTAILAVGVLTRTDTALFTIGIQRLPAAIL